MDVEIVVDIRLYEVSNILINGFTIRRHLCRTKLYLRLRLKNRLLNINSYGCNDTVSDVTILIFTKEFLDGLGYMFLKSSLMCTPLCCMLSIYERIILLSILVCMGESNLNIFPFHMYNRVKRIYSHVICQQILQSMAAKNAPSVVHYGKSCVQIGIVTEHFLHDIIMERVVLEERVVWFKVNIRTVFVC